MALSNDADPRQAGPFKEAPRPTSPLAQSAPANGVTTWKAITSAQPVCSEISSGVGQSYPLWLSLEYQAASVIVRLSDSGPTDDPMGLGATVFVGTRDGDEIEATNRLPMGGLACRQTLWGMPQTGGSLSATLASGRISGEYTEIYGAGADEVTFVFRFEATVEARAPVSR